MWKLFLRVDYNLCNQTLLCENDYKESILFVRNLNKEEVSAISQLHSH